ncbi:LpqB family beta-propeller domain-containing protein [Microbacterium sp. CFBP9034]|uniref:LpqB family beta-propeller domain-containing protein n=1 Tax=Microbacterium sp. CFBP9034 TaxID=3096540 RepID=UPI002A6B20AC|nr:LpqB family beta-propeller domain-containing protein [Microbacterium sp. CFBP9034]MDY0909034.1 LpqB family beta-propeller domain-containing protein [Microbacterium sp. CFBP9034]
MTRRRGILSVVVAMLAIVLTACTGLPTSGPVYYGLSTEDAPDADDVSFLLPDRPQPGASPEQIVEGFIRAGSGPGLTSNWDRAREFLTPEFRDVWKPQASVLVDVFEDRVYSEPDDGVVQLDVTAVASVDDNGSYERAELGGRTLPFALEQNADEEWRISQAPDGVVLDQDEFPRVFNRYSVMYFDPSWEYLVPDARWFPPTNAAASVAAALVNGPPSSWLAESVADAFPESVTVVQSVPVSGGVAEVDLNENALSADPDTLDRMYTQLQASLATAGVTEVELTVESTPIDAEPVPVRSTRVPGAPLALTEAGFGFLIGDQLDEIVGLSDVVVDFQPVAVQVSPDRDAAAARLDTGAVLRLRDNQTFATLDERESLVDPTIDPHGYIWSVPRDAPAAVRAYPDEGEFIEVADAWSGATAISAMAVSRDGTRVAAVVIAGGRTALWVAGIVRDPDLVPVRLGDPVQLATVVSSGRGLAWLDDLSVGVLSGDAEGSVVLEQVVGGISSSSAASPGMVAIAGGTTLSSVRLLADDGTLSVKRGTSWQPTATGVLVLATQQGTPE